MTKPIIGMTSRTKDGKNVLFLDYDNIDDKWLYEEIRALQDKFKLSHFIILQSSKGSYHAICFDKLTHEEIEAVYYNSSADPRHYKVPFKSGKKLLTLRISEKEGKKPKYLYNILSPYNMRQKSNAHRILLQKIYPNKIPKMLFSEGEYDTYRTTPMAKYYI